MGERKLLATECYQCGTDIVVPKWDFSKAGRNYCQPCAWSKVGYIPSEQEITEDVRLQ